MVYSDGDVIIFFNQTVENKTAFVALYNENRLVGLHSQQITGETVFLDTATESIATEVKIMVWENAESMHPMCKAYEISLIGGAE